MKKKISLMFGFILLFMVFLAPNVVNARELPTGSNFDYSIDMFTTTYYISYDLDGGTLDKINAYTPENDDFEIGIPTKSGYTFLGWTGSNGNIPNPKVTVKKGTIMNLTFKANWKKNKFGINYDFNGGYGEVAPTYYDIETQQIVLGEPERLGYTFTGWTGDNGTTPNKNVSFKGNANSVNYTANWSPVTYNINYNNGGTSYFTPSMPTNNNTYNINTNNFTLNNPTRTAYNFTGWTGSNGKIPNKTVTIAKGSTGDRWYKANWSPITYNITYTLNGGTNNSSNPTTYNVEQSKTINAATRSYYTFDGWTGDNGTTKQKSFTLNTGNYGDKSYTANWTPISYTISYNMNGRGSVSNPTSYTVETNTFTLNNPAKSGEYSFTGWTGTGLSGASKSVTISKGSHDNRSYTANWYDDTPPTFTSFNVWITGTSVAGKSCNLMTNWSAYDNGVGMDHYTVTLRADAGGHGGEYNGGNTGEDFNDVLNGQRHICANAYDKNGNKGQTCRDLYVSC